MGTNAAAGETEQCTEIATGSANKLNGGTPSGVLHPQMKTVRGPGQELPEPVKVQELQGSTGERAEWDLPSVKAVPCVRTGAVQARTSSPSPGRAAVIHQAAPQGEATHIHKGHPASPRHPFSTGFGFHFVSSHHEDKVEEPLLAGEEVTGSGCSKPGHRTLTEEAAAVGFSPLRWTTTKELCNSAVNGSSEVELESAPSAALCQSPEERAPSNVLFPSLEDKVPYGKTCPSLEQRIPIGDLCLYVDERSPPGVPCPSLQERVPSSVKDPSVLYDVAGPSVVGRVSSSNNQEAASPEASISMEEGEVEQQECPICTELYDAGRRRQALLNCRHTVCDSCVQTIMDQGNQADIGRIRCPICRQKTPMMKWEIRKLQEEMLERDFTRLQTVYVAPAVAPRRPGPCGALEYSFQQRFRTSRMFSCIPCLRYPLCFIQRLNELESRSRCCYLCTLALLYCLEKLCFVLPFLPILVLVFVIAFDK